MLLLLPHLSMRMKTSERSAVEVTMPMRSSHRRVKELRRQRSIGGLQGWDREDRWKHKKVMKSWSHHYVAVHGRKMEMPREEWVKKYSLHIFVGLIFLVTVVSISVSWYYRGLIQQMLQSSQTIYFDPRTRVLTLADPSNTISVRGRLGLDMPDWQLPLHCPIIPGENPQVKSCLWKENAILRINHFGNSKVQCYNISWESLHPQHVPYDCFDVSKATWYGPSNQSASSMPIQGQFAYRPTNIMLGNNGFFSTIVDFYWLSSSGVALHVRPEDPIQVTWNKSGNNLLCILSNYSGPLYQKSNPLLSPIMNYTLCNGLTTLSTHKYMRKMYAPKIKVVFPPDDVFKGQYWSVAGLMGTVGNVTQDNVVSLAELIRKHFFKHSKLTIDSQWEKQIGDLTFDPDLFPNVTAMTSRLKELKARVSLRVTPFFSYLSFNFNKGIMTSMFVKDAGSEVPGLIKSDAGVAAIIDVLNPVARRWYHQKIKSLVSQVDVNAIWLTYGAKAWLPFMPHFDVKDSTSNQYRRVMTETLAHIADTMIVEHSSDTRHVNHFIPVVTRLELVKGRECLVDAIEKALTLGLAGYPFVMADGLEVTDKDKDGHTSKPSSEIYLRWLQLSAFFPAIQYNIPPWSYQADVLSMAKNMTSVHNNMVVPELYSQRLQDDLQDGLPIMRPVWWMDSGNLTLHEMEIADEFLVGDRLLVAPILCTGMTSRNVYVPPGIWQDLNRKKFILGPKVLDNYPATKYEIPAFKRHETLGDGIPRDL